MISMKKILFVSNKLYGGGSEQVLVNLANYFSDHAWEVRILSLLPGTPYPIGRNVDVHYYSVGKKGRLDKILWMRKEWKEFSPDAVISFEYFLNLYVICSGLLVRGRRKTRLVVSERNDPARRGGRFPVRQIRNLLYHFCDVLVCQTPAARAYFPASIQKNALIIANPVKAQLPEVHQGPRRKEIVNFCRLEKQKNLPLLIEAFAIFRKNYPDYHMTIYGDGSIYKELEQEILARSLQEAVTLHPAIPDVHERIRDAAMFVSSSDYEGLSNSMLEAMALGLPVICTDCPCYGASMIIQDNRNGMLVPVGNAMKIAEAMGRIAGDRQFAEGLSLEAAKTRDMYSIERIGAKWEEILHA